MENEEWGPWIKHDGKGCPVKGRVIQAVWLSRFSGETSVAGDGDVTWIVPSEAGGNPSDSSWHWRIIHGVPTTYGLAAPIIRYRIRKPLGLTMLENAMSDLPETVDA